jgi:hypothetical protein
VARPVESDGHDGAVRELPESAALVTTAQLCAVTLVGALGLPAAGLLLMLAPLGALVGLVVSAALLGVIITATRAVSPLGATGGRRVVWVLAVLGGGTALGLLGWAVSSEAGVDGGALPLLGGIPYALVAGLLLRRWQSVLTSGLVLSVIVVAGAVLLRQSGPDELTSRLTAANVERSRAYVVEIPGYRPVEKAYGDRLGADGFQPVDPAAIPPEKFVSVVAYRGPFVPGTGVCGTTAPDSDLGTADCVREKDGWVYRKGVVHHGYQVRRGAAEVVVAGTFGVDRAVLRRAAATLRPASKGERTTDDAREIYAVTLPGYRGQETGIPNGMMYQPASGTSGAQSVSVTLRADLATVADLCLEADCSPAVDGLTYIRREHSHGFLRPRPGGVVVSVDGGILADTGRLRRATLDARLATDEELLRALPPAPAAGALDRWRRWLREIP